MKIIFAGTTEFGIPALEKLKGLYEIPLIVTQPDKPVGRKMILTPPPVKLWAAANEVPILQPTEIRNSKFEIQNCNPDLLLVAAYGQIIPQEILDIPKFGAINIHGSLLPKHRGATPIQAALLNGDTHTGISLITMDSELDHGPILASKILKIAEADTYTSLHEKLSLLAADLIEDKIEDIISGEIKPKEQNHGLATFTTLLSSKDTRLNWSDDAKVNLRKIKALNPEPGTWTTLNGNNVKILEAIILNETKIELPGKPYKHNGELTIKCRDHSLIIKKLIPAGKNLMSGRDYANGINNIETKIFI